MTVSSGMISNGERRAGMAGIMTGTVTGTEKRENSMTITLTGMVGARTVRANTPKARECPKKT